MAWNDVVSILLREDVENGKITQKEADITMRDMYIEWMNLGSDDCVRPPSAMPYYDRFLEKLPPGFVVCQ
jgi:hypothetical protein